MALTKKLLSCAAIALISTSLTSVAHAGSDGSELSADQLFFQNGDRMSGTVLTVNQDVVSFETAYGNVLEIPVDQISTVSQNDGASNYKFDAEQETLTLTAVETLKAPVSDTVNTAMLESNTNVVGDSLAGLLGFETKGFLRLGGNKQSGNTDRSGVRFAAGLSGDIDDVNRARLDADVNYGEENDSETENNASLALNYDRFISEQWFANGNLGFEKDKLADLDLETIVGIGMGYQPYKSEDFNLLMTLGPSFVSREDSDGSKTEAINAQWTLRHDQKLFDGPVSMFHNHDILQSLEENKDFVFESQTGFSVPISGNFTGTFQIDYDFDNDPAAGAERDDTTYSVNLGYEW